jgi:hypothetical protein
MIGCKVRTDKSEEPTENQRFSSQKLFWSIEWYLFVCEVHVWDILQIEGHFD